jgi:hypothetical protein
MSQDTTTPRTVPDALPVPDDPKAIEEALITLYPKMVKGTTAEVDPALVDTYNYAKFAAAYWEEQARAAVLRIREQQGDAEKATVNGVPVFSRRQYPVKGYWVDPRENDALYPVAGR